MADDKNTIGLSSKNEATMERLVALEAFRHQMDAAKLALALAIREGIQPGSAQGVSTVWNVGSLDPDGSLRDIIMQVFPEVDTPYRAAEYLINEGLHIAGEALDSNPGRGILALIDTPD